MAKLKVKWAGGKEQEFDVELVLEKEEYLIVKFPYCLDKIIMLSDIISYTVEDEHSEARQKEERIQWMEKYGKKKG